MELMQIFITAKMHYSNKETKYNFGDKSQKYEIENMWFMIKFICTKPEWFAGPFYK